MVQSVVAPRDVPVRLVRRLVRRWRAPRRRSGLALALVLVLGAGLIDAGHPATIRATPPTVVPAITDTGLATVSTDVDLTQPVTLTFATPMAPASVADALTVDPPALVDLAWDETATELTIAPLSYWSPDTLHTVTVGIDARAQSGEPLSRPIRTVFLTRDQKNATITVNDTVGTRAAIGTSFTVTFGEPVDPPSAAAGMSLDPATPGIVQTIAPAGGPVEFRFFPAAPLKPDVIYRLVVSGVRGAEGVTLDTVTREVRTAKIPSVVAITPAAEAPAATDAPISVAFSEPMDRRSTARAVTVTLNGKSVAGTTTWADADRTLVFTPKKSLPYDAGVAVRVAATARSTAGIVLGKRAQATFRTAKEAEPPTASAPPDVQSEKASASSPSTPKSATKTPAPPPAAGGGSWAAVESYYLGLMNCTRTGGWVTSTGRCSSPGGRDVAPLKLDSGISSKVSRPYAKKLAVGNDCSHFIGGNPGDRLRTAGYKSYRWAENLGCRSGDARAAVLGSHLFFQAEKSYLGGHYVNLMNPKYDRVGIGVWVSGGRVRLVVDFYHP